MATMQASERGVRVGDAPHDGTAQHYKLDATMIEAS